MGRHRADLGGDGAQLALELGHQLLFVDRQRLRIGTTRDDAMSGHAQGPAILDMRLQKLTGLERDKLRAEYDELMELIGRLKAILEDKALRMGIIKDELLEMKEKFGYKNVAELFVAARKLCDKLDGEDEPP